MIPWDSSQVLSLFILDSMEVNWIGNSEAELESQLERLHEVMESRCYMYIQILNLLEMKYPLNPKI